MVTNSAIPGAAAAAAVLAYSRPARRNQARTPSCLHRASEFLKPAVPSFGLLDLVWDVALNPHMAARKNRTLSMIRLRIRD